MLPFLLLGVAVAVLVGVVVVARHRERAPAPLGAPEPAPTVVAPVEPPRLRALVLTEAIPAPTTISGRVEPPRPRAMLLPPPPARTSPGDALDTLDALLAELESTKVRIDGADALDESSVAELEGLAARLEAAAESLASR